MLLLALLLSGCATSRPPAEQLHSLEAVNKALAKRSAVIEFVNDQPDLLARGVQIGPDTTTYTDWRRRTGEHLPTADIRSVSYPKGSGFVRGGGIGAIPGLALIGLSALNHLVEDDYDSEWGLFLGLVFGIPITAAGTAAGAIIGAVKDERRLVYEGPVDRYLLADPE